MNVCSSGPSFQSLFILTESVIDFIQSRYEETLVKTSGKLALPQCFEKELTPARKNPSFEDCGICKNEKVAFAINYDIMYICICIMYICIYVRTECRQLSGPPESP